MLIIAHRGASSLAPENTLAAARKALAIGATMWELDVALTEDGVPVLVHDNNLARTSNVAEVFPKRQAWPVHRFSLAEIRQLDFGTWFNQADPFGQIAAGNVSPADCQSYRGEPVLTLQEALDFVRSHHWAVNIEIKNHQGLPGHRSVVEQVITRIEASGLTDQVLISSFNRVYLKQVKAANTRLATAVLVSRPGPDPLTLLRRLDAQAYHPKVPIIQPQTISSLREHGFDVNVWTVNDEATMRHLIQAGASGLFTDFPQRLKALLAGA